MCTTYSNNEKTIKDANRFKLIDTFKETVNEIIFFNLHLSEGGDLTLMLFSKKTSEIIFKFSLIKK